MTEPRHLHPVPPSPSPSSSDPPARSLFTDAQRFAQDWMAPSRNQAMCPQGHALELCHMASLVGRHVADAHLAAGGRPARKAREELHRVIGLCLVLDDLLAKGGTDASA